MLGPGILARSISSRAKTDKYGNVWQYHPRSDHHSKVACWGIVFDLLRSSALLREHVQDGKTFFGINHNMRDFVHNKAKDLDLVLCTPSSGASVAHPLTLPAMADAYDIPLSDYERSELKGLPAIAEAPVGSVLMALEAKACMTSHQKALPRFHDELNSSHQIVHGATDQAIAVGLAMVNRAGRFLSPLLNQYMANVGPQWTKHDQPKAAALAVNMLHDLPRRSKVGDNGFDAFATLVIDCRNDGSDVVLVEHPPAPKPLDNHHYATMIDRLTHIYATRFQHI